MNMTKRMADLRVLDEKGFAAVEWNLYLDTHPGDVNALSAYRRAVADYNAAREVFENSYGPICCTDGAGTAWIGDPWPWDYVGGGF